MTLRNTRREAFMGSWRGQGPLGTWTFGNIEDGSSARSWSFPPQMTGGATMPATGSATTLAQAQTGTTSTATALAPHLKTVLPPRDNTDLSVEVRVLLAECESPLRSGYTLQAAATCMQLMDLVLWNRLKDPGKFGARRAKSLVDIVKAKRQFDGFEDYPNYSGSVRDRIQEIVNIANAEKDTRRPACAAHVKAAIEVAEGERIVDPSPGVLAAWRTAARGSPGGNFKMYTTVLRNTFFYIER
jgi:hypothetical protein